MHWSWINREALTAVARQRGFIVGPSLAGITVQFSCGSRSWCIVPYLSVGVRDESILAHANCTPLLEEEDLKNDRLKNYFFWTFATHMTQITPEKFNFTQFAAFFHFLFFKINYFFV